ncbi:MAG: cytochrome c oxidase assembly protein [Rickettsiella sp.]|nr:cytochrome c oxidase assembly protein [Rickettsiella sp.]
MSSNQIKFLKWSNKKLLLILSFTTLGMFGFGFAMIPLYNTLCKNLGINGKTDKNSYVASDSIDLSRSVRVEFMTSNNNYIPWDFYPRLHHIQLHPGENILIYFEAKNNSGKKMTVQAIPSVSPGIAAKHLKKTECFCFTQQTFTPGQQRAMPVLFHLDTKLPKDINTITLSYTLFDITGSKRSLLSQAIGHL